MSQGALRGTEVSFTRDVEGKVEVYQSFEAAKSLSARFDNTVADMDEPEWFGFEDIQGNDIRINITYLVDIHFSTVPLVDLDLDEQVKRPFGRKIARKGTGMQPFVRWKTATSR